MSTDFIVMNGIDILDKDNFVGDWGASKRHES